MRLETAERLAKQAVCTGWSQVRVVKLAHNSWGAFGVDPSGHRARIPAERASPPRPPVRAPTPARTQPDQETP